MRQVGIIRELNIFPVKSMQGISLTEAEIYWYGLTGDRRYGFVRAGISGGFPWLTGRQIPDMVRYQPRFLNPANLIESPLYVTYPTGDEWRVTDPKLQAHLSMAYGGDVTLLNLGRGTYDAMPVSLISTRTVATISQANGQTLDPRRFRINIVIDTEESGEVPEEAWLGKTLVLGEGVQLHAARRIQRCVMINIDPDTAQRDRSVLKTVNQTRQNCAGIYANVQSIGQVRVGDNIYLSD